MDDVVRIAFASALGVAEMEAPLSRVPGISWQTMQNPSGSYLRGLTPNGVKIRLVPRDGRWEAEIFFPVGPGWTRFSDDEKRAFVEWTKGTLLAAIGATDVD